MYGYENDNLQYQKLIEKKLIEALAIVKTNIARIEQANRTLMPILDRHIKNESH